MCTSFIIFVFPDDSPCVPVSGPGEARSTDADLAPFPRDPGQVDTTEGTPPSIPLQRPPTHHTEERVRLVNVHLGNKSSVWGHRELSHNKKVHCELFFVTPSKTSRNASKTTFLQRVGLQWVLTPPAYFVYAHKNDDKSGRPLEWQKKQYCSVLILMLLICLVLCE